mmetsp:Transcript_39915/g.120572  ORF Transcript_39915/g.120572 Transcript_39915/m.120572 type:complete len:414 (+) Transcript_39915:7727-8968(+)
MPLRVHGVQLVHGLLQDLLRLADLCANQDARVVPLLPPAEIEKQSLPLRGDLFDLVLDDQLLVGALADVGDLVDVLVQICLDERRKFELIGIDRQLLAGHLDDLLPMPRHDARLPELLEQRQHELEILDFLLQLPVSRPLAQQLRHLLAAACKAVDGLLHRLHVLRHLQPVVILVLADGRQHGDVQVVQGAQVAELLLGLVERRVPLVRDAEEVLADVIDVLLPPAHLVLVAEAPQALDRLAGRDALHHGAAALVRAPELGDVLLERRDGLDQVLPVLDLGQGEVLLLLLALLEEVLPILLVHRAEVRLVLADDARQVLVQDPVHVLDRDELQLDLALLLPDLPQRGHDRGQRVDVAPRHLAGELLPRPLHHLGALLQLEVRVLVELLGEGLLPIVGELLNAVAQARRLQHKG